MPRPRTIARRSHEVQPAAILATLGIISVLLATWASLAH